MATSTPINATQVVIRISEDNGVTWKHMAQASSATLSIGMETRDITSKFAEGWRTLGEGKRSWSLSGEGFIVYSTVAGETNPNQLMTSMLSRVKLKVQFTTWSEEDNAALPGDPNYKGDAYLTSLEQTGGVEENGTYSFTFEGSGPLVVAINP